MEHPHAARSPPAPPQVMDHTPPKAFTYSKYYVKQIFFNIFPRVYRTRAIAYFCVCVRCVCLCLSAREDRSSVLRYSGVCSRARGRGAAFVCNGYPAAWRVQLIYGPWHNQYQSVALWANARFWLVGTAGKNYSTVAPACETAACWVRRKAGFLFPAPALVWGGGGRRKVDGLLRIIWYAFYCEYPRGRVMMTY